MLKLFSILLIGLVLESTGVVLLKKGVRFCYIAGSRPIVPGGATSSSARP